jgi:hypothetical protein
MENNVLDTVSVIIQENPHAAQSLLLFALLKTLDIEKSGHMYMLAKLKEFEPENRQLAYGLMEMMAQGQIHDEKWRKTIDDIEAAMRGA